MTDFVEAVARRSSVDITDAGEVLERHGVRPWVEPPRAPRLRIEAVEFSGVNASGDDFNFSWSVGPGVWALSSVDNDVGKSSVLEVIRWLLSGRDQIVKPVRAMISSASLRFTLGEAKIVVSVTGADDVLAGAVVIDDGDPQPFTEASFEATMDEIMLERLALRPLLRWQKHQGSEDGRETRSGWTAFIPALFLPHPSSDALLGNAPMEAGTLLQVFLGLPWYMTERQAALALNQIRQEARDETRRNTRDAQAALAALEATAEQLKAARAELTALPEVQTSQDAYAALTIAVTDAAREQLAAEDIERARAQDLQDAEALVVNRRRALRIVKETVSAGAVFSELKAELCPRCEVGIGEERREAEVKQNVCMVCGRVHDQPTENAEYAINDAEQLIQEAERQRDEVKEAAAQALEQATRARERSEAARKKQRAAEPDPGLVGRRAEKQVAIARLEGKLEEQQRRTDGAASEVPQTGDEKVLTAAQNEAKSRMADSELMASLSTDILQMAHRFGLQSITELSIDRAARLPVTKGTVQENFSKLTSSEKLRLRVATVIALLRVVEKGGPARHPGLIVIDSPAAEELAEANLDEMLKELTVLSSNSEHLQVLIATTRTDAVAAALESEHVRFVPHGEFLW